MDLATYRALDATDLAALVARREVTPSELVEAALQAVEADQPRTRAVVHRFDGAARARARDGGAAGPFAGVPLLVKDNLPIRGTPTTFGSVLCREFVARSTHPVAGALDRAGFIVLGRTNMSEVGLLPTCEPALHGPTHNPWARDRSPGGSSGGSAAAVAAGTVPVAHGNDGGGSLRIPASACGVFGLKPSAGRMPTGPDDHPSGYICEGVLSRTVRDAAAVYDALAAAKRGGRRTPPTSDLSFVAHARRDPLPLRIGFATVDPSGRPAHPECRQAVHRAARLLESLGHRVEEAAPDVDGAAFDAAFLVLWSMSAGYFLKRVREGLTRHRAPRVARGLLARSDLAFEALLRAYALPTGKPPLERVTRLLVAEERRRTPADLWVAWNQLEAAGAAMDALFRRVDLWLTPTLGEPPWRIGELDLGAPREALEAKLQRYAAFTPIANTAGLPAMSLPLHRSAAGLPVGVQIVAPYGREDRLFALAGQVERAAPWPRPPG